MSQSEKPTMYAWGVVLLLMLAYVLSFIDRQILGMLITPIKASLNLTDTQLGVLMGPAFAVFYVTLGWPIGWLADRANRRNIIAAGIALWSLATAACGLSRNFAQLLTARIGVGIGEAALTPSALSMISDYFSKEHRPRAISLYMTGIYVGSALAYLVGGGVVAALQHIPKIELPVYGEIEGWQAAFLAVGLPGLLVALAIMCIREPARRSEGALGDKPQSLGESARYLARRWKAFGAPTLGMCSTTLIAYLAGWNIVFFQRVWNWEIQTIGLWMGVTFLIAGPAGTAAAGWLGGRMMSSGRSDGAFRVCAVGVALMGVSGALFPLMPTPELAFLLNGVATFGGAFSTAAGPTAIVAIAPSRVRAQASAIYFMIINLIGLSVGPLLVGVLTDNIFTGPTGIGPALSWVAAGVAVPAVLALWAGHRHYAREAVIVSESEQPARAG